MSQHGEEEGVVPTGAFDFSTYGRGTGMGSKDVECEPAQDGEVLGSIVHSGPVAVLVEVNVEHPVQLVLDGPVTARDLQQPFGGHMPGQQVIRSEEHTSELQSPDHLVCRLLLEKKKTINEHQATN